MSDEWTGEGGDFISARQPSSARRASRSEFDFINFIRRRELRRLNAQNADSSLITHHSSLLKGIGDDAAVIRQRRGFDTVITADLLVEGVDFDLERFRTSPRDLGHKALAVSLSDIAAMGASPSMCLLSVGVPRARWESGFLEQLYEGVFALAARHAVNLIGGDISRTPRHVVIDSIVLGETRRGRAVLRSGARPGDQIFLTGALGGAAAGLRLLQEGSDPKGADRRSRALRQLMRRQTRPTPRVEWGRLLGERRLATALIDLSDGLSSDLSHLCAESGVGASIEAALLPLDSSLKAAAFNDEDALRLALDGGEDFELLFTVRPRDVAKLPLEVEGVRLTRVGAVTAERGRLELLRDGRALPLRPGGFEHFKRRGR
ncbi:MAG TPA: thiamine-phosphate kinase [Pyrinomonadaceae bacterium]|nr:thiamine-phosphate kinase [Pyrinomonadaceae bacterium]